MKFTAIKAAVAICLLVPVMAMADTEVTGSSFSDIATKSIAVDGFGGTSVAASWDDFRAEAKHINTKTYAATSLIWQLFQGSTVVRSGSFDDALTPNNKGVVAFNESGLSGGQYLLKFVGTWNVGMQEWNVKTKQDVSLGKVSQFAVSPVPEPESYAMLLAGLGLMGTIALRRKKSDAS